MSEDQNMKKPTVSVIMPFYNAGKHLHEAVSSILNQSFSDFELLLINDRSTDHSLQVASKFTDPRIRLLENSGEKGRSSARNLGIDLSTGELIAIMDSDDISYPERLERQVSFMRQNPLITACGTAADHIGANYSWRWETVTGPEKIRCELLFQNCFIHSTLMFRKKPVIDGNYRYKKHMEPSEDYDFIARISETGCLDNLTAPLVGYRIHNDQVSSMVSFEKTDMKIKERQLAKLFPSIGINDLNAHHQLSAGIPAANRHEFLMVRTWTEKLAKANNEKSIYHQDTFNESLSAKWLRYCQKSTRLGLFAFKTWKQSSISGHFPDKWGQKFKFAVNCLLGR